MAGKLHSKRSKTREHGSQLPSCWNGLTLGRRKPQLHNNYGTLAERQQAFSEERGPAAAAQGRLGKVPTAQSYGFAAECSGESVGSESNRAGLGSQLEHSRTSSTTLKSFLHAAWPLHPHLKTSGNSYLCQGSQTKWKNVAILPVRPS